MTPEQVAEAEQKYRADCVKAARADFEVLLERHPESGDGHELDDALLVQLFVCKRIEDSFDSLTQSVGWLDHS